VDVLCASSHDVNQASRLSGGALETGDVMQIRTTWFAMGLPLVALAAAATAAPPKAIDLPSEHMFPESLSIGTDGTAYLGSMHGGVLRVSMKTGKAEQWIKPAAYGTGALFGVYVDARNRLLWTCTNDFSARGVTVEGSDKGTFLKGFDLRTGAGKISLKLPGEHPICNDMAVAKDGSLYVADTGAPHILRWKPGAAALEIWVEDPVFGAGGLDGIAIGSDGNILVNNVRTNELFTVVIGADGKPGKVTKLALSRPLTSPDGMRHVAGMSFALAEGAGRISKVTVAGDRAEIETLAEGISEPTGVDTYGGFAWYSQGHLSYLFNPAKKAQIPEIVPFRLTPVPWKK
jgi:sugar lactone lactonase YvrE